MEIVWKKVSAGHSFTCGIRSNGAVRCWGKNDVGQSSPPPYPKYAFQQVSASVGGDHACGVLMENGAVQCWGNNGRGQSEKQDGMLKIYLGLLIQYLVAWRANDPFLELFSTRKFPPSIGWNAHDLCHPRGHYNN